METTIKGNSRTLYEIFGGENVYDIPYYQRPYAWTIIEANTLFEDLRLFFEENDTDGTDSDNAENEDNESSSKMYFLGSMVLVHDAAKAVYEVIDGQQRLTTLAILFSVLHKIFKDAGISDYAESCKRRIYRIKDPVLKNSSDRSRVKLRQKDSAFFENHILNIDIDALLNCDANYKVTEAQQNLVKNIRSFLAKFGLDPTALDDTVYDYKMDIEKIKRFVEFLSSRCVMVVVETEDVESSFRVFSVMNNRGLNLLDADLFKARLIGELPDDQQDEYSGKWDGLEIDVHRSNFNSLFGHIRIIKAAIVGKKPKKALREEFYDFVLPSLTADNVRYFIDEVLTAYADAYKVITEAVYKSSDELMTKKVNDILRWLKQTSNSDWIPPALLFYVKNHDNPQAMFDFLSKLERLSVCLWMISMRYPARRTKRYADIIIEIEAAPAGQFGSTIELTPEEKIEFKKALNSKIYTDSSTLCRYLVLRADSCYYEYRLATYVITTLSIEHVLPQTVTSKNGWEAIWPDKDQREEWVHKIGNLFPLSKRKNSKAKNYSFAEKKKAYFEGEEHLSPFATTRDLVNYTEWTPADVEKRQNELMCKFTELWDLN